MPDELSDNEQKEAWDVVQGIESSGFQFSVFTQWLKENAFQVHDVGKNYIYKGTYGYVLFDHASLGNRGLVVQCAYTPYTNPRTAYGLVTEGVSTSGKSLSQSDLELLKQYRYEQVENIVITTIAEDIGQLPEPHMTLRDDLDLDEEIDFPDIIIKLEDEFDCIIPDDDAKSFMTVEDIISFIRKKKGISV